MSPYIKIDMSYRNIFVLKKPLFSFLTAHADVVKDQNVFRKIHCSKVSEGKTKVTAELSLDIESKLEAKELKHRKHPGIRTTQCFTLPDTLLIAADKIASRYDSKTLGEDAKKMNTLLWHRQLPVESSELEMRTMSMMQKMNIQVDHEDQLVHEDSMKKMSVVRKQLKRQLHRWKPIDYTEYVCVIYMAARLAQNYAAICKAFSEMKILDTEFKPKTFFDFGSGVGSAVWAAHSYWGESIQEYFCVDAAVEMNNLAETLLQGGEEDAPTFLKQLHFRQFLPTSSILKYDLVVSAFSMLDVPSMEDRMKIIDILWQKTNDTLVIVENGGNTGFSVILDARDYILKLAQSSSENNPEEVHIVAPCTHDLDCPLFVTKKICHFPVSYYPLYPKKDSSLMKTTHVAYIVLKKGKRTTDQELWPRIIKPVVKGSRKAHCHMCCPDGKYREIIFTKKRHGRHAYRCVRMSSHGDLLPVSISEHETVEGSKETNESDTDDDEDNDDGCGHTTKEN